jgi:hypothetical protein
MAEIGSNPAMIGLIVAALSHFRIGSATAVERDRSPHLGRRLVLAQPLIDDLPEQIVVGPG